MRAALLCLALVAGCASVPASYVEADRATYEAIGRDYSAYVENDSALDLEQKDRRYRLLRAWAARLDQAEAE